MPQIGRWDNLPEGVRQHPIGRMRDRAIGVSDLNQLRLRIEKSASSKSAAADRTAKRSCSEGELQTASLFSYPIRNL